MKLLVICLLTCVAFNSRAALDGTRLAGGVYSSNDTSGVGHLVVTNKIPKVSSSNEVPNIGWVLDNVPTNSIDLSSITAEINASNDATRSWASITFAKCYKYVCSLASSHFCLDPSDQHIGGVVTVYVCS